MARCLAILSAVVCAIVFYPPSMAEIEGPVPKEIVVPPGHKPIFELEARGVQIYRAAKKDESGKLEWVLEAPLADLSDGKGGKAGYHYDGPSWEAPDGSKVAADKAEARKSAPAPNPEKDIPWLMVKVKAEEGKTGKFTPVAYIQRVRTAGGHPPNEEPKRAGTRVGVAYRAVYSFHEKAR